MARQQRLNLSFPIKGITENAPYGNPPRGTTLDALNVVNFDVSDQRMRGGKRPGTGRAIRNPVAEAGKPVQRMKQVRLSAGMFVDPGDFFLDPSWDLPAFAWPDPEVIYPQDPSQLEMPANPYLIGAGTLSVANPTADSLTVTYSDISRGVEPFSNLLQRRPAGTLVWQDVATIDQGVPHTDSQLEPETTYEYRVLTQDSFNPPQLAVSSTEAGTTTSEDDELTELWTHDWNYAGNIASFGWTVYDETHNTIEPPEGGSSDLQLTSEFNNVTLDGTVTYDEESSAPSYSGARLGVRNYLAESPGHADLNEDVELTFQVAMPPGSAFPSGRAGRMIVGLGVDVPGDEWQAMMAFQMNVGGDFLAGDEADVMIAGLALDPGGGIGGDHEATITYNGETLDIRLLYSRSDDRVYGYINGSPVLQSDIDTDWIDSIIQQDQQAALTDVAVAGVFESNVDGVSSVPGGYFVGPLKLSVGGVL